MQAYVQRSDLNLAREIAANGKELLGIVLFSKKFELKHEFLYYQEMPDTMQLDCFCSWNPSFFGENTNCRKWKEMPDKNASFYFRALVFRYGFTVKIIWFPSCIPSDCKRCRKFSPSARVSDTELCTGAASHCSFLLVWCGSMHQFFFLKHQNTRN